MKSEPIKLNGDCLATDASSAFIERLTPDDWLPIARRFHDFSYQQHPAFARLRAAQQGGDVECVIARDSRGIIGAATVRIRTAPLIGGVAYIAGGPLVRIAHDPDAGEELHLCRTLIALRNEYAYRRRLSLRILGAIGDETRLNSSQRAFAAAGMHLTERGRSYRTFLVNLAPSPEELLANCSKYWRRNLRRAERNAALRIRTGTHRELFEEVGALHVHARNRKQFSTNLDASFYAALQSSLDDGSQLIASVVDLDGQPVSGLIHSLLGDTAVPLILASSEVGLRNYAAYLIQWHSIMLARHQGMQMYDLGGIDPERNPSVYDFKIGLRGQDITAPGPYEAAARGMRGLIFRQAEEFYRRISNARPFPLRRAA